MGNRKPLRQHAPYLYLARPAGEECYYLFVAIHKKVNEEVRVVSGEDGQAISYEDGQATITFSIRPKAGVSAEEACDFFLMRYDLKPPSEESPDDRHERLGVEVYTTAMNGEGEEPAEVYENSMAYADADEQPLPEGQPDGEPAYNCPYIYLELSEPSGEEGRGNTFHPYVLLAPKGYRLADGKDKMIITSPGNGVLEDIVVLSKTDEAPDVASFHPFIDPARLEVNTQEYTDSGRGEGNFAVILAFRNNEAEAEEFRNQEPAAMHRSLLDMEPAKGNGQVSDSRPADAPSITMRKAKTRNMSSRRKRSRSVSFKTIA